MFDTIIKYYQEMNITSLTVVFIIIWWIVFFIILPIGIKQEENPIDGNDKGAPKNPNIKLKILITTIISMVLSLIYYYLIVNQIIIMGS